jgi:hypothetical protein
MTLDFTDDETLALAHLLRHTNRLAQTPRHADVFKRARARPASSEANDR